MTRIHDSVMAGSDENQIQNRKENSIVITAPAADMPNVFLPPIGVGMDHSSSVCSFDWLTMIRADHQGVVSSAGCVIFRGV
jgi:hypothetical protein